MSAWGNQTLWKYLAEHGVIVPMVDAAINQIGVSTGLKQSFDERYNYYANTPRGQYELKSIAMMFPGVKEFVQHDEHMREMDNTLDLYGMDYGDVGYFTKTIGSSNPVAGMTWNYVSKNLDVLYE